MPSALSPNSLAGGEAGSITYMPGPYRRTYADFCALDHALAADDLVAAQDAYNRLLRDALYLSEMLSRNPFLQDNGRLFAFKELGERLRVGDLSGAKHSAHEFHSDGMQTIVG